MRHPADEALRAHGFTACPACDRLRVAGPFGCRCIGMPAEFPVRDRVTGLWVSPTTGEVFAPRNHGSEHETRGQSTIRAPRQEALFAAQPA